jgi:hypothetical protein
MQGNTARYMKTMIYLWLKLQMKKDSLSLNTIKVTILGESKGLEASNKTSHQYSEHKGCLINHLSPLFSQVEVFSEPIKKQKLRRKNKLYLNKRHPLETLLLLFLETFQQVLRCLASLRGLYAQDLTHSFRWAQDLTYL